MQTQNKFIGIFFRFIATFLLIGMFATSLVKVVYAHELQPSVVDFKTLDGNRFELNIKTNAEALISNIGVKHLDTEQSANAEVYNKLRATAPDEVVLAFESFKPSFSNDVGIFFDGIRTMPTEIELFVPQIGDIDLPRFSVITLRGKLPVKAGNFEWVWPKEYGASIIRVDEIGKVEGEGYAAFLRSGVKSEPILLRGAKPLTIFQTVKTYIEVGFTHIIPKGLDHILFVVGLFLLSVRLRPLLWQITAFTVAHTVTLALGVLGFISISPAIVEPLIAASIVYVAVENIMTDRLQKWRPIIVFCFGLLHGLGFAGVLGSVGLSSGSFVVGLISFNVGVELGQLAIIALCFLTVGIWFGSKPWYRRLISIPASVAIAIIALWWVYERVFIV